MIQITIQLRRKKKKKNHNVSFARAVDFRQRLALWPDGRQQLRRELVLRYREAAESFVPKIILMLLWLSVVLLISFGLACAAKYLIFTNRSEKPFQLRSSLSEEEAVEIYLRKLAFVSTTSTETRQAKRMRRKSEYAVLADKYRVSPRTIMDVWNRKTWVQATSHLWESN